MKLKWTNKASSDVGRLYEFLASVNAKAAKEAVEVLITAPTGLLSNPRLGERLEEFDPQEVRRILIGSYEIRYEIQETTIYILRIWHTREMR